MSQEGRPTGVKTPSLARGYLKRSLKKVSPYTIPAPCTLEMVQHDDEQSWAKMSRLMSQVSVEDNLKKGREQFVDSLPIGMKNAIRDEDL